MNRRGPLLVLALLALAGALIWAAQQLRIAETAPSVVIVTIDTLRADRVGAYDGSRNLTPNLDRIASDGVVFDRVWTVSPLTVPAHVTAMTGLAPPAHGLRTNHPRGPLPPADARTYPTLAEILRGRGCRTAAFVSSSVLRDDRTGLAAGFDVYDEVEPTQRGAFEYAERRAEDTVEAALEWVRGGDGPIFLWVHLFDPHAPYDAPAPFGPGPTGRNSPAGYDAEVEYADHWVGALDRGLAKAGYGDAIFVVTSDHGEALGQNGEATHGYLLHESTLHVPMILRASGRVGGGERRAGPGSLTELTPTILGIARLPRPIDMAPRTLLEPGSEGGAVYAESLYGWQSCGWAQLLAVRDGDNKAIDVGAGSWVFDLATDAEERRPRIYPAVPEAGAPPPDDPTLALLDRVRAGVEAATPAGTLRTERGQEPGSIPYAMPIRQTEAGLLPRAENAALPSPYERMPVVALLDRARMLVAMGRGADAVKSLEGAAKLDADNPQVFRLRARALASSRPPRFTAASAAYREAWLKGWEDPACVARVLQMAVQGADAGEEPNGLAEAREFLADVRGRGAPDTGDVLVLECAALLRLGDRDGARRAHERASRAPRTPFLEKALAELSAELEKDR